MPGGAGRGRRAVGKGRSDDETLTKRQPPLRSEGADATHGRIGSSSSVSRKKGRPGRKRGARSTGRYPFVAWINKYLSNCGLADETIKERRRRLTRIYHDLQLLESDGKIGTTNPEKMTENEVGAFVDSLIARGKKGKDFEHDVTALNGLLKNANNLAIESLKNRYPAKFRKSIKTGRYPPLDGEEFNFIVQGAEKVDPANWYKIESYAIVVLGLASGARHKELKEGKVHDLCLRSGDEHYHIEHPKGEDSYGETRDPPLRPECQPFLRKYLQKRKEMLVKRPDNEFLFPALRDKADGKLSSNSITRMVRFVGQDAQVVKLDLHKCRRTFGQMLLDEGVSIEVVSVLMGHASTAMTEKFYCRRRQQQASFSVRNIWGKNVPDPTPKTMPDVKNPLIDKNGWNAGYA